MSQSLGAMAVRTTERPRKELPACFCLRDSPLLAACSKTGSVASRILHSERLTQFVKFWLAPYCRTWPGRPPRDDNQNGFLANNPARV